jgi:chaperonin GroEL (HSP60 family)
VAQTDSRVSLDNELDVVEGMQFDRGIAKVCAVNAPGFGGAFCFPRRRQIGVK